MRRSKLFKASQILSAIVVASPAMGVVAGASAANINDFTSWTLVQDPPHLGLSASANATQISLVAIGAIPAKTDIGYQSVNGIDVASSTSGAFFSPSSDFAIAVDVDVSSVDSIGLGAIGIGIGEDGNGADSAGVAVAIRDGVALAVSGAARIDDITQNPQIIGAAAASGRLFVAYASSSGDVTVGFNPAKGAAAPSSTTVLGGIQNDWNDAPLLVSLFLRSDQISPLVPLTSGQLGAVFSHFEVLSGVPVAVPEPSGVALAVVLASFGAVGRIRLT